MNILAFDTCFDTCSVAVGAGIGGGRARVEAFFETRDGGHAERLLPMIASALDNAGLTMAMLDRVAVTIGPGTFTGTRIGIAAARGFVLARPLPLVVATSLAVMAEEAADEIEIREEAQLLVAVDARRGAVYAQLFGRDGRAGRTAPLLLSPRDAAALGEGPLFVVGSGAEAVASAARESGREAAVRLPMLRPDACTLLYMAERLAPLVAPPAPLYLRDADAKPQDAHRIARACP